MKLIDRPAPQPTLSPAEVQDLERLTKLKLAHAFPCQQQARWVKWAYIFAYVLIIAIVLFILARLAVAKWNDIEPYTWTIDIGVLLLTPILVLLSFNKLSPVHVETKWRERCQQKAYAANQFPMARLQQLQEKQPK